MPFVPQGVPLKIFFKRPDRGAILAGVIAKGFFVPSCEVFKPQ